MDYNHRNDEIHDNIVRMRAQWEAERDALATVRRFNARLSAKGSAWFWPKISAALTAKHHWLVILFNFAALPLTLHTVSHSIPPNQKPT